ncbi:MAG: hypothetical protein COA58_13755 [Bacteroidetes bacterium]|nr:MAG: hypothetical protein COA58_13755 [Bacteroidota bacterium]
MMAIYLIGALCLGLGYFLLLSKYATLWESLSIYLEEDKSRSEKVSVLVPFRNEESNLPVLIKSIQELAESMHEIEFIFINDHSTDSSVKILEALIPGARVLNLEKETGKKAGVSEGIRYATGDIILQTDADCILPSDWINEMVRPFEDSAIKLVSGPVRFTDAKNFWGKLVNLDFAALIAIGAAHIEWGKPLMCNGANMAYRKREVEDMAFNTEKASGDDVFLLQYIAKNHQDSICFLKSKRALVYTDGPKTFTEFWNQRLRWSSKNGDYEDKTNIWVLIMIWLYNVIIVVSLMSLHPTGFLVAAFLILFKILAEDKFYGTFSEFFGINLWFKNLLFGQPFHILYMVILPPISQLLKYKWKERKVR